jgi:hypothetical protein
VHLVTLLEEMPVQETLDAAAELKQAGFQLGAVIVNRARPVLMEDRHIDQKLLAAGLRKANLATALAAPLMDEVAAYCGRLDLQAANAAHLDALDLPRIELPDLNPPVERGELNELAQRFLEQS